MTDGDGFCFVYRSTSAGVGGRPHLFTIMAMVFISLYLGITLD